MAQDRVLGEQIDVVDLSQDLAAEPTAIGNLATGITNDPGAVATMDADYVRRDGTTAMAGVLTVNNNIIVTGTVDGRDIATDGTNQDSHIGDTSLHFTVASINHQSVAGAGTYTHSSIDGHISDGTLHFTEAAINHVNIQNVGTNTHTVIDAHLAAAAPHTGHLSNIVEDITPELGTALDCINNSIGNAKTVTFTGEVVNSGIGVQTVDWTTGQKQKFTFTGATTLSFTSPPGAGNLVLKMINPAANITWGTVILWHGGLEPVWTTTGTDLLSIYYDGTDYYGMAGLNFG